MGGGGGGGGGELTAPRLWKDLAIVSMRHTAPCTRLDTYTYLGLFYLWDARCSLY